MSYRAVLTDPTERKAALLRLWSDNLPVEVDPAAKHRWLYLDAPTGRAEAFVLEHDNTPVGCAGITVRELWHGDDRLRAALLADFAINRAHRTVMPALILQRSVKRHVEASFDLSYGFPNAHAVGIHLRTGYHALGELGRYVRVLRHGGYLARSYGDSLAARAAGVAVDTANLAMQLARAITPVRARALRWLEDLDVRFDRLWETARAGFGLVGRRDAAFLRWRFLAQPGHRNRIAALVDRRSDALRAYAIVGGQRGEMAHLHDVFGDLASIGDLLLLLVPALYARGHTAVSVRFLGDPRLIDILQAHHFSLRDRSRTVIVHEGAHCAIASSIVRDPGSWYITDLDEDT